MATAVPLRDGIVVNAEEVSKDLKDPNVIEMGTEVEAEEALRDLQATAAETETQAKQDTTQVLQEYVNPNEANDLEDTKPIDVSKIDFSLRPHITFRERFEVSQWLRKHRKIEFDPDDVLGTSLTELSRYTWELVPQEATVPMFGTTEDLEKNSGFREDRPYTGPPPSNHPMEKITKRCTRAPFDPMRERLTDYKYPEFTDLYKNRLDPDISVFLITDEEWMRLQDEIIHPRRKNSDGTTEYFYPISIPHDFDLNKVPAPTDDEMKYGVPLKQLLTHPYDWHIFRAPLTDLRQDEVDRIVHIAQSLVRKHKPRLELADNIWCRFTIRLTAFDHAQEVPKNLSEELVAMPFYKGRRHLTEFFHRHHKKMRADKLINDFVEEALKQFHPDDVLRQRRYKNYLDEERLVEEMRVQLAQKERIERIRASYKWYLAPWYMIQAMLYQ